MNHEPIDITEDLELLLKVGEGKDAQELVKVLDEHHTKYCHLHYDRFSVRLITQEGKTGLVYTGLRKETEEETKKRVAKEEANHKKAEEAELQAYLRLKKKYEKKGE